MDDNKGHAGDLNDDQGFIDFMEECEMADYGSLPFFNYDSDADSLSLPELDAFESGSITETLRESSPSGEHPVGLAPPNDSFVAFEPTNSVGGIEEGHDNSTTMPMSIDDPMIFMTTDVSTPNASIENPSAGMAMVTLGDDQDFVNGVNLKGMNVDTINDHSMPPYAEPQPSAEEETQELDDHDDADSVDLDQAIVALLLNQHFADFPLESSLHESVALVNQEINVEPELVLGDPPAEPEEDEEETVRDDIHENEPMMIDQQEEHGIQDPFSPSVAERILIREEDITVNDVRGGQESAGSRHPGNLAFLRMVAERNHEYHAYGRQHGEKTRLSNMVVNQVLASGGRFVKRSRRGSRVWHLLTRKEARAKVSQVRAGNGCFHSESYMLTILASRTVQAFRD
jgi:hypothetical protein